MYPPKFEYVRPETLGEAIEALADADTRVFAGGQSLLSGLKQRQVSAKTLVDIDGLEQLRGVNYNNSDGSVSIGAATSISRLLESEIGREVPVLEDAIAAVGDRQIRNRGTVGGNLVQADPGADVPAAMLALGASVTLHSSRGKRQLPLAELYTESATRRRTHGPPAATVQPDELLTHISIPRARTGGAYVRKTHPATGYATVGVACQVQTSNGRCTDARVGVTGVFDVPTRLDGVENALLGIETDPESHSDTTLAAIRKSIPRESGRTDPNVSGEYRIHLLESLTQTAVSRAFDRIDIDGGSA